MIGYVCRRIGHAALLLFGVSVLSFVFVSMAPGNYFDEMRMNPQISPDTAAALRAQYGLDQPLAVRYLHWLKAVLHGDLGFSFAYNQPAGPLLFARILNTLLLTLIATAFAWIVALPLGLWSAGRLGGLRDHAISSGIALLMIVPDLLLALGFLFLAVRTGWFPAGGMASLRYDELSWTGKLCDLAVHLALPVGVLVLGSLPLLVRHIRSSVAEVLDSGFLRSAAALGIPRSKLLYRYALRAAANPLISLFGFSIGALLSGSLMVEVVMSWPGLGPLLLEAILARDLYVVIGGVMLSAVFLVGGNLIADLLLYWADPRIRA